MYGSKAITSPDGINWTLRTTPTDNNSIGWWSVTYGNNLFVAVAGSTESDPNKVMTSPDGINWTLREAIVSPWRSVTYGNGLFVAVSNVSTNGGNKVMTSPDGITWTLRTTPSYNVAWTSVTYGDGLFVAVAVNEGNRVMTSSDGINWTLRTTPTLGSWTSVAHGNGLFVAVSGATGTILNRVITSPSIDLLIGGEGGETFFGNGGAGGRSTKFIAQAGGDAIDIYAGQGVAQAETADEYGEDGLNSTAPVNTAGGGLS